MARLLSSATHVPGFDEAEPGLVARLASLSLRTARRIVGRFVADNTEADPADPAANEVSLSPKRNGRWALRGDLDAETAAVILNELRRLAEAHRDDEDLTTGRCLALALLDMARRSVTLGSRGPGSRPELVIVADAGLFGDLYDERFEDGTPVTRQVFEALSCDATVRGMIVNGPSEILDLGRSQRLATPGSGEPRLFATAAASSRAGRGRRGRGRQPRPLATCT